MRVAVVGVVVGVCAALVVGVAVGGCPGQTATCAQYVDCQAAIDPDVDTSAWQPDGACWALPSAARQCDAQCAEALEALRQTPSPPAVCAR